MAASEWISDVEGVGRVRCMTFRDQRGPGGVFRITPVRATSTEQLGLSREVESLALEPGGLILVAGPRLSGKRTTISALVDFMNRTRRDHVITVEREFNVIHGAGTSIISQREARGGADDIESVARAALREDPDVLVIESLQTAALVDVALDAVTSGQLVIGGIPAHDTASAIDHIINLYPAEKRQQVQLALAKNLRGVGCAGAGAKDRRGTRGGARGPAEHDGRCEHDCRRADIAVADGHRCRTQSGHAAAERRACGSRSERRG